MLDTNGFASRRMHHGIFLALFTLAMLTQLGCWRNRGTTMKEDAISEIDEAAAFAATSLQSDDRIKSVLDSADTEAAAAMKARLDKLASLRSQVDPVIFTALVEILLSDETLTAADMGSKLDAVIDTLTLVAQEMGGALHVYLDKSTAAQDVLFGVVKAAREYRSDRSAESATALLEAYWAAVEMVMPTLADQYPINSVLLKSGSSYATKGDDSIDKTVGILKGIEGAKTGVDSDTETMASGLKALAIVVDAVSDLVDAAEAKGFTADDQAAIVKAFAQAVNAAGPGMTQVATIVAERTQESLIAAGKTATEITSVMGDLVTIFGDRQEIADASRAAAKDAEQLAAINALLAQVNQQVSYIDDQNDVSSTKTTLQTTKATVISAGGDLTQVQSALQTSTTDLDGAIAPPDDSDGGDGGGDGDGDGDGSGDGDGGNGDDDGSGDGDGDGDGGDGGGALDPATCENAAAGDTCGGGEYVGEVTISATQYRLVTTPGNCNDNVTITCDGTADTLGDAWAAGASNTTLLGATSTSDGSANTTAYTNGGGDAFGAMGFCREMSYGGHTDWYLPATADLEKMDTVKASLTGIVLNTDFYYASTEVDATTARTMTFDATNSLVQNQAKNSFGLIRCVRRIAVP